MVRRGLRLLHERFTHAAVRDMKRMIEKAGLEVDEDAIKQTVDSCKACRLWKSPDPEPQVSQTVAPTWTGKQVQGDFKFYKGAPIWHMLDRAVKSHAGRVTADRSQEAIRDVLRIWLTFWGKMKELVVD